MAKIKEENISFIHATFFHNQTTGETYPVRWYIRGKRGESRVFESYGKNATDYPYPIDKLPKAVQAFLETAVAGAPIKAFPETLVEYTRG